jgi:hypothetical protein
VTLPHAANEARDSALHGERAADWTGWLKLVLGLSLISMASRQWRDGRTETRNR